MLIEAGYCNNNKVALFSDDENDATLMTQIIAIPMMLRTMTMTAMMMMMIIMIRK